MSAMALMDTVCLAAISPPSSEPQRSCAPVRCLVSYVNACHAGFAGNARHARHAKKITPATHVTLGIRGGWKGGGVGYF
jgi:hypothetical protein